MIGLVLALLVFLAPESAFACGDPAVFFITGAILAFQLVLLLIIFVARRSVVRDRLKCGGFYLLSLIVIWIVSSFFIHRWLDSPGQNFFEELALVLMPVISIVIFRFILAKSGKSRIAQNVEERNKS